MRDGFLALLLLLGPFCPAVLKAAALPQAASFFKPAVSEAWSAPGPTAFTVPEAPVPAPVFSRGDFSQLPQFSFTYLNDLNTKMIDAAGSSMDVAMFSMTLADNPDALLRAAGRGVKVRVILDEKHVYPKADAQIQRLMKAPGIEFRTLCGTRAWGINHNKILIADREIASAGSYNWTFGATFSNLENTLVMRDSAHVSGYAAYFDWMWSKARTLDQGASPAELPDGYYGLPPQDPSPAQSLNGTPVPAYLFSPGSRSEERLAAIIDAARTSLNAVTFSFSSKALADAVIRARERGVKVRFMMDKNMAKDSIAAKSVFDAGVEMRIRIGRTEKGALHDKFAILDGQLLETGSFNWTSNASVNSFENIVFTSDTGAIKAYQAAFDRIYAEAAAPAAADLLTEAEPAR